MPTQHLSEQDELRIDMFFATISDVLNDVCHISDLLTRLNNVASILLDCVELLLSICEGFRFLVIYNGLHELGTIIVDRVRQCHDIWSKSQQAGAACGYSCYNRHDSTNSTRQLANISNKAPKREFLLFHSFFCFLDLLIDSVDHFGHLSDCCANVDLL